MFLDELAEPTLLVIYPGRFQPFHKGHKAVYDWLTGKFGANNVYIATSDKTDNLKSPFGFSDKVEFMKLTGVPANRILFSTQPYQITSIEKDAHLNIPNKERTVVIFAVSEKDMAEDPRFSTWTKKDGSPAYFQPLKDIKQTESMEKHGYIMTVPTFDFTVLGQPMTSASEIRSLYTKSDRKTRQHIIKDLFGRYSAEAEKTMNDKLDAPQPAQEPKLAKQAKLQKVAKPKDQEELAEAQNFANFFQQPATPVKTAPSGVINVQGYQVQIDPVRKELVVSKNGQVLHRERTSVGRPATAETIRSRISAILDKLQDEKYPDDLEVREATIGSQMDFDNQMKMRKYQQDLAQQKGAQQAPQAAAVKRTPQVPYTPTMADRQAKVDRLNQLIGLKQQIDGYIKKYGGVERLPRGLQADVEDYYSASDVDAHYNDMLASYQKQLAALQKFDSMQTALKAKPRQPMEAEGDPEGLPHLTKDLASHISQQIDTEGPHAVVKSVEWGDGAAEELLAKIKEMLDDYASTMEESAAWKRKEGKSKTGGLNKKGVASYRREHPGSKLQTAVTTKPSKLKKGSKAAKRRKSFCARMGGMKGPMKDEHGKPTRKALALRKWNCESVEQYESMLESYMVQAEMLQENLQPIKRTLKQDPWIVYLKDNPSKIKKFKTRDGAKAYVDRNPECALASFAYYVDHVKPQQVDEIDRRGFLKGLGAAALAGVAPSIAKSQVIGGGEDEAKNEATKAANTFYRLCRNARPNLAKEIYEVLYQRLMQFYNFSGGVGLTIASEYALNLAISTVEPDFQAIYQAIEKDKESASVAKAVLLKSAGLHDAARDEQLKAIGSLERWQLKPLAEKFIRAYTQGLQAVLEQWKNQPGSPASKVASGNQQTKQQRSPEDQAKLDKLRRDAGKEANPKGIREQGVAEEENIWADKDPAEMGRADAYMGRRPNPDYYGYTMGSDERVKYLHSYNNSPRDEDEREGPKGRPHHKFEDAGGVGVIANKKQAKDPRYSTSLTKDVRPGQINKSLKAFNLAEHATKKLIASGREVKSLTEAEVIQAYQNLPEVQAIFEQLDKQTK